MIEFDYPARERGGGDRDELYRYGRPRPNAHSPYPFTQQAYARLLILRGRVQDGLAGLGDLNGGDPEPLPAPTPTYDPGGASESINTVLERLWHEGEAS